MRLIIDNDNAIMGIMKLFIATGARNYIALVGKKHW